MSKLCSGNNATMLLCAFLLSIASCTETKSDFGQWNITGKPENNTGLSWAKFYWENDSLGNRFFQKAAMFIPTKIEGLPYLFSFQFDLGSDLTLIYGENSKSVLAKHPEINFKNPTFVFGNLKASTPHCYIREGYGNVVSLDASASNEPISLGTIGVDMFQNKILIIDYPNERFCICDTVPQIFSTPMADITLDRHGRILLPMLLREKNFKIMFDNGSSIFQLITVAGKVDMFSKEKGVDTIQISSWGKLHNVIGRPMPDSFMLAGQHFSNAVIFADYREDAAGDEFDAITGNALFLNKVLVIDFKNKKFGIKDP